MRYSNGNATFLAESCLFTRRRDIEASVSLLHPFQMCDTEEGQRNIATQYASYIHLSVSLSQDEGRILVDNYGSKACHYSLLFS